MPNVVVFLFTTKCFSNDLFLNDCSVHKYNNRRKERKRRRRKKKEKEKRVKRGKAGSWRFVSLIPSSTLGKNQAVKYVVANARFDKQ